MMPTEGDAAAIAAAAAAAAAAANPTIHALRAVHHPTVHVPADEMPEKFNGLDFKRWQQKMHFYQTTLGLSKFLKDKSPVVTENETNPEVRATYSAWGQGDYLCRNYVLNGPSNKLYNVYSSVKTSKELWVASEKKYKNEDVGAKKFIVGKFPNYKMVDLKTVVSQVQEFKLILQDIHAKGMTLSE